ncbi:MULTISPECIES: hypothetical protein [unclassified Microbacterium]|uniref:hypothetical protein n=1 Tax=unclassified Microbacterium TaxID=2609290 RepID=UPI00109C8DBB|nr:hypothetical protein [Microbacterium sp. K41]
MQGLNTLAGSSFNMALSANNHTGAGLEIIRSHARREGYEPDDNTAPRSSPRALALRYVVTNIPEEAT